jgi:uncharacterized protein (DUF1501 family)
MKRRNFLKKVTAAATMPAIINGIPIQAFAEHSLLQRWAATSNNDKVLIILQLHGGNDGLNTLIPIDQYSEYYNLRPNIAIPERGPRRLINLDNTLPDAARTGVHPDMIGVKDLYDQGKVGIVQGVSYENNNGSHFRGRDIWFMGGGYNDYFGSGWLGRFLNASYPGYPDGPPVSYPNERMPDPLGLEIGTGVSIAFHRDNGIPAGLAVQNPRQFYELINSVGGAPPETVEESYYGDELQYIMGIEQQSNQYASRLREVYDRGSNSPNITYPETYPFATQRDSRNVLSGQLRLIARLLSGGIKTKVFLARIGGFDTHAQQVESYDATMGHHAALLYHISEAMRAFQADLQQLGLEDRVLSLTYSEFGRRPKSNGSFGTDHGTGAPMLLFGKGVTPGVFGTNPDLRNLEGGNIPMQFDYRQVLASVVKDWLGASDKVMQATYFDTFLDNPVPVIGGVTSSRREFFNRRFRFEAPYPNPARDTVIFSFYIDNPAHTKLQVFDLQGRLVATVLNAPQHHGQHDVPFAVEALPKGMYLVRLEAGRLQATKKLYVD